MHLIQNEQTKLHAMWLNNVGAGIVVVGCLGPVLAWINHPTPDWTLHALWSPGWTAIAGVVLGYGLHRAGVHQLRHLREGNEVRSPVTGHAADCL
jgi:hypothetical protein